VRHPQRGIAVQLQPEPNRQFAEAVTLKHVHTTLNASAALVK